MTKPPTLTCIERGETSDDGEGWKAELAIDLINGVDPDEVAVFPHRHRAG